MPQEIRPTTLDDLPELSRFLAEGFHAPADAPFSAPDVLAWKYLDPRGADAGDAPRSWLARDEASGAVVGHLGITPGRWRGAGLPAEGVSTLHMIDWLSSEAGRGVGASLMRRAHRGVETGYGLGGSADGRGVGGGGGYGLVRLVPVYQRVLRPSHHGRAGFSAGGLLRTARDAARLAARRPKRPGVTVEIEPATAFGDEAERVLEAYAPSAAFTTRSAGLMNHMMRYPRGGLTGWVLKGPGGARGFAVLSVVTGQGGVRVGKVVECLPGGGEPDEAVWHASFLALTAELKRQGADVARAVASTAWSVRALAASGYARAHDLEFRLRDRSNRLARDGAYHLTFLEADYAYT
ncbi:MAG: acetyltransferase [Isosphaeraceae bacterium]